MRTRGRMWSPTQSQPWPFCAEVNIRSEEHTSELQSRLHLVCRLLLEKKNNINNITYQQNFHKFSSSPDSSNLDTLFLARYNYVSLILRPCLSLTMRTTPVFLASVSPP